jgi:hypothetical protein
VRQAIGAAVLGVSVAVLAAGGRAEVDAEVPLAVKAKGTILPQGEVETFRFEATERAALTLSLKAAKGAALDFQATLLDGSGEPVEIDPSLVLGTPSKLQWKGVGIPASGDYAVEVRAAGTGEYSLSLKGKAETSWEGSYTLDGTWSGDFDLAAPAGSTVTLEVRAGKGSAVVPKILSLEGKSFSIDLSASGKVTPVSHVAKVSGLPSGGACSVRLENAGGAGQMTVKAKVKAPKVRTAKLDVRGATLGSPGGGETLLSREVDASGGTVRVEPTGAALDGASVTVPPGALAGGATITIADAEDPGPATGEDQAAGPAVAFGPAGIAFSTPVQVTVPYDPAMLPAGADGQDVRVRVVEEDGSSSELVPVAVNEVDGTVTVETTGFSVFQAVVEAGMPRLEGTDWWMVQAQAGLSPDPQGNDSRYRWLDVEVGAVRLDAGTGTADVVARESWWENLSTGGFPPVDAHRGYQVTQQGGPFGWTYGADGRTVVVDSGGEFTTLVSDRAGNLLVGRNDTSDPRVSLLVLARKPDAAPPVSALEGTWWLAVWEVQGTDTLSSGAASPQAFRFLGTLRFDGAGKATVAGTVREAEYDEASSAVREGQENPVIPGTCTADADGTFVLDLTAQDPKAPVLRLRPSRGLQVLVGTHRDPGQDGAFLVLAVRQPSGFSAKEAKGTWAGVGIGADLYASSLGTGTGTVPIADASFGSDRIDAVLDGSSTLQVHVDSVYFHKDPSGPEGIGTDAETMDLPIPFTATSTGKLSLNPPDGGRIAACLSEDGAAMFLVKDPAAADADYFLAFLVQPPPKKAP